MKVRFKYGIATYSGTIDEMVYGSYRDDKLCIGREYVYPRLTEYNESIGTKGSNLALLWSEASAEFKADLKTYAQLNGSENVPKTQLPPNAYALWIKLMFAWQKDNPSIDLGTLTASDFSLTGTDANTVNNAVENGYLKAVTGYETLTEAF